MKNFSEFVNEINIEAIIKNADMYDNFGIYMNLIDRNFDKVIVTR